MSDLLIRKAKANDLNFIIQSVFRTMREDSVLGRTTEYDVFVKAFPPVIDGLLERSITLIACMPDEPNIIFGFAIAEPPQLHFVFVKADFQRLGIARALINAFELEHPSIAIKRFSFLTDIIKKVGPKFQNLKYDPFQPYKTGEPNGPTEESP